MDKVEKIILVGAAASGKDYLADYLVKKGLSKSITYTTRPIRDGEVDGVVYNFISINDFKEMESNSEFYEYENFKKDWYYGSTNDDWDTCNLFIKTVGGIKQISDEDRKDCFVVFLDIPRDVRFNRLLERSDNNDLLERRMNSDDFDFDGFDDFDLRISDDGFDPMMVFDLMD